LFVGSVHGAPLNCEGWNEHTPNQVAVARIATTQPRVHFIAGPDKRRPACPSLQSNCKLKAFLVPGDEVLVNVTEQGPYGCATFKGQNWIMTRGFLPRAALQVTSPAQIPAQQWEGKWRRDSQAEIVTKSRDGAVEVSGTATWRGRDTQHGKPGPINTGELNGTGKPGDTFWPLAMIRSGQRFHHQSRKHRTSDLLDLSGCVLRARHERPRCRRAAERADELSPPDADCYATLPWGSCPCNRG
jgi:hypothetical protein